MYKHINMLYNFKYLRKAVYDLFPSLEIQLYDTYI